MQNKLFLAITVLLCLFVPISLWLLPSYIPIVGAVALFISLALSTYSIYTKRKGTEHARAKILKEAGVMVLTLIIVIFLGGIASMLANYHTSMRWGAAAGLVSAIAASFLIGYIVRAGLGRSARYGKRG